MLTKVTDSTRRYLSEHRLQRDTAYGLVATGVRSLLVLATTTILVRSLSETELGIWSFLVLFTTQGFVGFIDLGLHQPVTRRLTLLGNFEHIGKGSQLFLWYRRILLRTASLAGLISVMLLAGISERNDIFNHRSLLLACFALLVLLFADAALLPHTALLEARERILSLRNVEVFLRGMVLVMTAFAVVIWQTAISVIFGTAIASLSTLFFARWRNSRYHNPGRVDASLELGSDTIFPKREEWLGALFARIGNTLNWQVGRTLTLILLGFSAAGNYEVLMRFQALSVLLVGGLTGALFPRLVASTNQASRFGTVLSKSLLIVSAALVALWSVVVIHGSTLLTVWLGDQHERLASLFWILMLTQIFTAVSSVLELGLVAQSRDLLYALSRWVFLALHAGSALFLGHRYGLEGILLGGLLSSALNTGLLSVVYSRACGSNSARLIFAPVIIGLSAGLFGVIPPIGLQYLVRANDLGYLLFSVIFAFVGMISSIWFGNLVVVRGILQDREQQLEQ